MRKTNAIQILLLTALLPAILSCSSEKNTAKSRFWHSFTAKYNIYYNGTLAYIEGSLAKEDGNKDNYTEIIPLYTVGNKSSVSLGSGSFDKAIEKSQKAIKLHSINKRPEWTKSRRKTAKDIEWLNRREYNPMMWKAWMLMGRSQFHKGAFDEAAATFSYMSRLYQTQPAIYCKARAWLAKCYIEQDWLYDAEDVIRNMQRDSIDWHAQKEWNYTYADYYIHTGEYEKAIPYLRKVIKQEMRRKQRAREWFLMGQLEAALGHNDKAYKAYKKVLTQNPPYELAFNARIAMTEVMAPGNTKKTISRLRRMAASDNNKDYLDQVYYAMGNVYLLDKDTTNAISAYEKGNEKSTRNGVEKGVLLLRLGDLYWDKEKFGDAQRCYGSAIGMLDKERDDYEELSRRSKILDELAPFTDAIHLQDSLLELSEMPEKERLEAIDRVIEALKKKEKEEKKAQDEAAVAQAQQRNNIGGNRQPQRNTPTPQTNQQQGEWYFYNQMAVSQGKTTFQRQWGKRENEDNWQRSNKTVVGGFSSDGDMAEAMSDSIQAMEEAREDSLAAVQDSAQNDPHKREYYLAQIPFTEEQKAECHTIIADGLFHSGIIFKDKLDNLRLSEKQFARLTNDYPEFEKMDEAYYHLFLLHSRKGDEMTAKSYISMLSEKYPESQWTKILTDPYFVENSKWGEQMEDSLYAATYNAFKASRSQEVYTNAGISEERFPLGANRDKFVFLRGLSRLNDNDAEGCLEDMNFVVKNFPSSRISEMAGMIVNGVNQGRQLRGGKFDLSDVWSRRSVVLNDSDSINSRQLIADRNKDFLFILAYHPDSINENQLLYEMARFNFTTFVVRNFDIEISDVDGIHQMKVSGFRFFDEAYQYAQEFYKQSNVMKRLGGARVILISSENLELLGKQYSYDDYAKFYTKHFAPLKPSREDLLNEPSEIGYEREPDMEEALPRNNQEPQDDGDGGDDGFAIPDGNEGGTGIDDGGFDLPEDNAQPTPQPDDQGISMPQIGQPRGGQPQGEQPQGNNGNQGTTDNGGVNIPDDNGLDIPDDDGGISVPMDDDGGFTLPDDGGVNIPSDDGGVNIPSDDGGVAIPDNNINVMPQNNNGTILPDDNEYNLRIRHDNKQGTVPTGGITPLAPHQKEVVLPTKEEDNQSELKSQESSKRSLPQTKEQPKKKELSKKKEQPQKKEQPKPVVAEPKKEDTGIYFDDGFGEDITPEAPKTKKKEKELEDLDLEDEYYDLDGF